MYNMTVFIGVAVGLVLSGLSVWLNLKTLKIAGEMPPREGAKQIIIRYMARIAALTVFLGLLTWLAGLYIIIGILSGMVLGSIVFLVVSRGNRTFIERLVNGPGGRY
jgi:hypothetical protein